MFDSVLDRGNTPKSRFGVGAVVSVIIHVAVLGLAIYFSTRKPVEEKKEVAVVFKVGVPPPPPPPPPAGATPSQPKPHPHKTVVHKEHKIVIPKEPQEQPKEAEPQEVAEPEPEAPVTGGQVGGVIGGVAGGVVGGQVGGQVGALPFGEGMTRPVQTGGEAPRYTREALEAHVTGLMLVQCTITTEGDLKDCKILKPLPHMEKAVLDALSTWKFKPVTYQGRPVNVRYVIQVKLVMPNG